MQFDPDDWDESDDGPELYMGEKMHAEEGVLQGYLEQFPRILRIVALKERIKRLEDQKLLNEEGLPENPQDRNGFDLIGYGFYHNIIKT